MSKRKSRTIPREDHTALVNLLAAKREKAGVSQRELSRRLGIYEMAFSEIERHNRGLLVTEFIDAASELGEDPVALLKEALQAARP